MQNQRSFPYIALGIAAWIKYVGAVDEQGQEIIVKDPLANELHQRFHSTQDFAIRVQTMLNVRAIFGEQLPANELFVDSIMAAYQHLETVGAKQAIADLIHAQQA